ncbi:hypothetical protein CTheo_5241 [Ceratobasidium theobromae]|uniref:Uncharacterized protein n=1 Tax=Ceratobasidium theobromae TaxID=1582974 RepID=A0A5N5QHW0_9AGAM|nr:hypothetical protein CTheo_5241 [Ceratobasidium theobromae]
MEILLPSEPRVQVLAYRATHKLPGNSTRVSDISAYFIKASWVKVGDLINPDHENKLVEREFDSGPWSEDDPDGIIVGPGLKMWYHTLHAGDKLKYTSMKFGSERIEFSAVEAQGGGKAIAACNLGPDQTVEVYQRQYVFEFEAKMTTTRVIKTIGFAMPNFSTEVTNGSGSFDANIMTCDFRYGRPPLAGVRMVEMWPMCDHMKTIENSGSFS